MPKSIPKNHAFVFFVDLCQKPGKLGFWHWEAKNRIKFVYFVQNPLFTFVYMLQTQIIFRLPIAIYTKTKIPPKKLKTKRQKIKDKNEYIKKDQTHIQTDIRPAILITIYNCPEELNPALHLHTSEC